jgi:hypothetical protein
MMDRELLLSMSESANGTYPDPFRKTIYAERAESNDTICQTDCLTVKVHEDLQGSLSADKDLTVFARDAIAGFIQRKDDSEPQIEKTFNGYSFYWPLYGVTAKVYGVRFSGDTFNSVVEIKGRSGKTIVHNRINMLSASSVEALIRRLLGPKKGRVTTIDWELIIPRICHETMDHHKQDDCIIDLSTIEGTKQTTRWSIEPLILRDQLNVLFGPPGSCKSLIALWLSGLLTYGAEDLPFTEAGVRVYDQCDSVLYLDWESSKEIAWENRMKLFPDSSIFYRRIRSPLAVAIDIIRVQIDSIEQKSNKKIGGVIIDSLGPACGGDLNASSSAIECMEAIGSLGLTSLIIAHPAKNSEKNSRSIIGSYAFSALSRNTWEVENYQEVENQFCDISLFHHKNNLGKKYPSLSLRVHYADTMISVSAAEMNEEAKERLPLKSRIKEILKREGPMNFKQIADELGTTPGAAKKELSQLKSKGDVDNNEVGQWRITH